MNPHTRAAETNPVEAVRELVYDIRHPGQSWARFKKGNEDSLLHWIGVGMLVEAAVMFVVGLCFVIFA